MRSAGDAPESVGEQTLNFRAIRDDDVPESAAEDQARVRQANGAPPPDAHSRSMADDDEGDTFFAFARPAAHDLPRSDDHATLDPEPAFDTLTPMSAADDFDAFAPAAPTTFDAFRAYSPAPVRETPPADQADADGPESAGTDISPENPSETGLPEDEPFEPPQSEGPESGESAGATADEDTAAASVTAGAAEEEPHEPDSAEATGDAWNDTEAEAIPTTEGAPSVAAVTDDAQPDEAAPADDAALDSAAPVDDAEADDVAAPADGVTLAHAAVPTDDAAPFDDTALADSAALTDDAALHSAAPGEPAADADDAVLTDSGAPAADVDSAAPADEVAPIDDAESDDAAAFADSAALDADLVRSAVPTQSEKVLEEDLPDAAAQALTAALDALKEAVADLRFGLELPGAEEARQAQAEILTQLRDYVLPRVRMSAAPALIVVAGSTGAGKSTLVNTLAEKNVSRTGVRRPTTGIPVLACHPDDEGWFADGELLAGLERIDRQSREAAPGSLVLVTTERLPQGVALLDTPDIDSVVEEHHEIARRMLDAADLWVFVTTAARYADAPAWNLLRLAKERAARIAIVLSRVQPKTKDVVLKHFVRMLTEYGLGEVERFVIEETAVEDGKLPHGDMTELRMWLAELSVDEERRAQAVQETLNGVLNSFRTRAPALARHLEGQVAFRAELRTDVDVAYTGALTRIETAIREGDLLGGEVRARWQDFAGSGDLTRSFRRKGNPVPPERITAFRAALRTATESLITSAAHHAADEVGARWRRRSELGAGLDRPSDDLARRTGKAVAAWQEHVTELLRTDGVTKRSAKVVSLDAASLSLIFMVGLFSADELPQKLLKGLLGAEALRSISAKALSDLRARIVMLFDEEAMRYVRALDAAGIPDEAAATRLYQATYNLEVAR
ncbi:dynamin family protein [Nonomuraea sp. NPDC059194]|uniref:dynamin family protein n=1 Tax=Nonomuraea sp. NPDC059194 TaxID=3346764 RepID=UPI0036A2AD01